MSSQGPDLRRLKVHPIEGSMKTIVSDVSKRVGKCLKTKTLGTWDGTVDFNSLEFKFHLGQSVFKNVRWNDGELMTQTNNK